MTTETEVKWALDQIVSNAHEESLNWCVNYAKRGKEMEGEDLRHQVMYILTNMTHWRGELAKDCRKIFKDFLKKGRSNR